MASIWMSGSLLDNLQYITRGLRINSLHIDLLGSLINSDIPSPVDNEANQND